MASKKPPRKIAKPPRKQRPGRTPIIDNPGRPRMIDSSIVPRRINRRVVTMEVDPSPSKVKKDTMNAFPKRPAKGTKAVKPGEQLPDQIARADELDDAPSAPGYFRLRLHVEDGQMRVRSARFVAGPIARPTALSAGYGYEARIGRRRVAIGDVPNPTEIRSFPDPNQRTGMDGHQIAELTDFDFSVRIPADELDEHDLTDLRVDLFNWRGKGPDQHLEIGELSKQPKSAVTDVARLSGIDVTDLPTQLRNDLSAAFEAARR